MVKSLRLITTEVDDIESAVAEITTQLGGKELLRHSVGIVSCFADFINSGVVAALAEKLPFPIAGTTTLAASTNNVRGEVILILTVLTSDDVEFTLQVSGPI
jgi:hypothetical protein